MKINPVFEALSNIETKHLLGSEPAANGKAKISRIAAKIMMTSAAVMTALGISLTAGAAVTDGFTSGFTSSFKSEAGYDEYYKKPTVEFSAASYEGAPETIGQTYAPSVLKGGVHYRHTVFMNPRRNSYYVNFMPETEDRLNKPFWSADIMQLIQHTKENFRDTFNIPAYVDVKEITINGCPGFIVSNECYCGIRNFVVWDNGDYIFSLKCVCPEEEAMKIAESVMPCDEATGEVLS